MDASITILMSVRDAAAHLPAALESILAQTHERWRLLALDDGSSDASAQILTAYAQRDRRVRLLARHRRSVEMRLAGEPPVLEGVPGVTDVRVHDGLLTCQLEGEPGPLLAALQGVPIDDLLIEPARLEEAFMEYYAEDEPDVVAGEEGSGR